MKSKQLLFVGCWLLLMNCHIQAATVTTAEHTLLPTATGWVSSGAGMQVDGGQVYDKREAQTFTAAESGKLGSVSFIATRSPSTNVDLRVSLTSLSGGQPKQELATSLLDVDSFEIGFLSGRPEAFNASVDFSALDIEIEAQQQYAIVFSTDTVKANYNIFGGQSEYDGGKRMFFKNNGPFESYRFDSDIFFKVAVNPVPEPSTFLLFTFCFLLSSGQASNRAFKLLD